MSRRSFVNDLRRAYYQDAAEINADMLKQCFAAGECELQFIVDISLPGGSALHLSDSHLYVGNTFYEGRIEVPRVERKMTELLAPSLSFSEIEIVISNVDGKYNELLPGGSKYTSFIGETVDLKVGLGSNASTYRSIFRGRVHPEGALERGAKEITIRARDELERWNRPVPLPRINPTEYPDAPEEVQGKIIPLVLGDWEFGWSFVNVEPVQVEGVSIETKAAKDNLGGVPGYFVGYDGGFGGYFLFGVSAYQPENIKAVLIKRGDTYLEANFMPTPFQAGSHFAVHVNSLKTMSRAAAPYTYQSGDLAVVSVKVPYELAAYSNPIGHARHLLMTLSGLSASDFDASTWLIENKTTPSCSAMTNLRARTWIGDDDQKSLERVINLLKQVRVDLFVGSDRRVYLRSLHPEDFPQPTAIDRATQFEIDEKSIKPQSDRHNFFTFANANYAFSPITGKTVRQTVKRTNQNAVQKSGQEIGKTIDFPNLYIESDVVSQVDEYVRLFSANLEYVSATFAWTNMLRELGDFLALSFNIGSVRFENVPMMVRSISINSKTGSADMTLLSLANFPYPNYQPDYQNQMYSASSQTIS